MTLRSVFLGLALVPAFAATASATVAFSRADPNHDGFVTYEEALRVFPRLQPVHFQKCDPNGDGLIDKSEYPLLDSFYWTLFKTD